MSTFNTNNLKERIEEEITELLDCKHWTPCHVETLAKLCKIMEKIHEMENIINPSK